MSMEHWWTDTNTGENRLTLKKICPSVTRSNTNLTWSSLELNPGLCGESRATNRLRHGTANRADT